MMLTDAQIIEHAKHNGWVLEPNPNHNRYGPGGYWSRKGTKIPYGTFTGPKWEDVNGKRVKTSEGPYTISATETMRRYLDHNDRCGECNLWIEYGYYGLEPPAPYCIGCKLWRGRVSVYNLTYQTPKSMVFVSNKYEFYSIGSKQAPSQYNGFGGQWFTIKFNDGRIVKTCDLWFGGEVPKRFRNRLKPTAIFMK